MWWESCGTQWCRLLDLPICYALGMLFVWVMRTFLPYLGPDCCWLVHWWGLPSGWLRGLTHTMSYMLFYRCFQDRTKQHKNETKTGNTPNHNSNFNDRRSENSKSGNSNRILGKRGDTRKRIREYQRPKNDYRRGKEKKTNTNNELKEENKNNGQRKRKNNKYKKRKEER